jgi:CMP/dCMP kinase
LVEHMIIAIDGPAASGKGTIGHRLAAYFGYRYLDTGLLYRAVAKKMLDASLPLDDERSAEHAAESLDILELPRLRDSLVTLGSSAAEVAALPRVRGALIDLQRQFASSPPGAVLDGRDIGTVICPHADVKIFVTASPQERARRRTLQLQAQGQNVREAEILADILSRDERDRSRSVAPLRPAADAFVLDTTDLDIEAAVAAAIARVEQVRR